MVAKSQKYLDFKKIGGPPLPPALTDLLADKVGYYPKLYYGSKLCISPLRGLGEMFDFAKTFTTQFPLRSIGRQATRPVCTDGERGPPLPRVEI